MIYIYIFIYILQFMNMISNIQEIISFIGGICSFIIFIYIIFIIYNRKHGIIRDTGYIKIVILNCGIIFYYYSCNFMSYSTSSEYINYFIFRNIGISLFISIVLIFNTLSSELSKLNKNVQFSIDDYSFNDYNNKTENNYCQNSNYNQYTNTKKSGINMSVNDSNGAFKSETLVHNNNNSNNSNSSINNNYSNNQANNINRINSNVDIISKLNSNSNIYYKNTNKNNFSNSDIDSNNKKNKSNKKISRVTSIISEFSNSEMNEDVIKKIKRAHSTFLEILIIYFILIIAISINVIYIKSYEKDDDESNILQNKNGQWSYHSKIESIDVGLNILYLLLLVNIIIGSKNILERECIFKYVYNIYYSSFIGITLGPLINVM